MKQDLPAPVIAINQKLFAQISLGSSRLYNSVLKHLSTLIPILRSLVQQPISADDGLDRPSFLFSPQLLFRIKHRAHGVHSCLLRTFIRGRV